MCVEAGTETVMSLLRPPPDGPHRVGGLRASDLWIMESMPPNSAIMTGFVQAGTFSTWRFNSELCSSR